MSKIPKINSFIILRKLWPLLHRFSRNSQLLSLCGYFYMVCYVIRINGLENTPKISLMPPNKEWGFTAPIFTKLTNADGLFIYFAKICQETRKAAAVKMCSHEFRVLSIIFVKKSYTDLTRQTM